MTTPAFTTPEEFAERLGITPASVRDMARDGRLASIKTSPGKGGKFLIPTSELDRLLREAEANRRGADRLARLLTPEAVPIRFPADGGPAYLGGADPYDDGEDEF